MKHLFLTVSLFLLAALWAGAQKYDIMQTLEAHPEYLDASDYLCPTGAVKLSASPRGYKPFYISHYGRHGARYAWQSDLYDRLNNALSAASRDTNLTAYGKEFKRRFDVLYPEVRYRVGDLSRKGWQQQQELADRMYTNFPAAFRDKTARVRAWTSTSTRCVMTMSAFCLGLKAKNAKLDIFENFGKSFLPAILPQSGENPFRNKDFRKTPLKYTETPQQFVDRNIDYKPILARLFVDINKAVAPDKQWDFVSYLYYFVAGMRSLDNAPDFSDLFTRDERIALWKYDNFQFYSDVWPTHLGYQPIVDDIISKADERIAAGEPGADLRFGHDYTIYPLLMILDVDGMGRDVENPDDLPYWTQIHRIPMGANLQIVFYRGKASDPVLIKVLLNGEEAHLPLETSNWPYYEWNKFKARYQ